MIRDLSIKNLALIESMSLEFTPGFTVFTGETGAGKSILIGAIGLLLGDRASSDSVRNGFDEAEINGIFELDGISDDLRSLCTGHSIDISDNQLIIRRRISRSDRSRIYVNEVPLSLAALRKLGSFLIDMHGQHEHQSLLDEETHRTFIDRLDDVRDARTRYDAAYGSFNEITGECARHAATTKLLAEKREMIEFQLNELEHAHLKVGEEEELEQELKLLTSSAQRIASVNSILELLASPSAASIGKQVSSVKRQLDQLTKYDPSAGPWTDDIDNVLRVFGELETYCGAYLERIGEQSDPDRIEKINGKLAKIQRLKKKYNLSVNDLLCKIQALKNDLASLENGDADRKELEKKSLAAKKACITAGEVLGGARRHAAATFDASITALMHQLGFKGGSWRTVFEPLPEPMEHGLEAVRFFVRTNPGEPELPLASTASGGEISRLMLAIKSVLAKSDYVPVLIFDEIDTGIGGTVAGYVAQSLKKLSSTHQVLCISHLHQIASLADQHVSVYKDASARRTVTHVKQLSREERIEEIARMLGGDSAIALQHARELLNAGSSENTR
jgi:DNA repair protein RecN (Recombination protein N)